jgi:hypothetical protein
LMNMMMLILLLRYVYDPPSSFLMFIICIYC